MDTVKFSGLVDSFGKRLTEIDENITGIKPAKDKWSLKEIVGHLIDSASNNHQRFVWLQLGNLREFPVYEAEQWIAVQKYNEMDWNDISALWRSYNHILLKVIEHIDAHTLANAWFLKDKELSLEFLVNDYYRHMEWHIGHFEERLRELT